MKAKNSSSPSTVPCGTPESTCTQSKDSLFTTTLCRLFMRSEYFLVRHTSTNIIIRMIIIIMYFFVQQASTGGPSSDLSADSKVRNLPHSSIYIGCYRGTQVAVKKLRRSGIVLTRHNLIHLNMVRKNLNSYELKSVEYRNRNSISHFPI